MHLLASRDRRSFAVPSVLLAAILARLGLDLAPAWEWRLLPFADYAVRQAAVVYVLGAWFAVAVAPHLPVRWNRIVLRVAALLALAAALRGLLPPPLDLGSSSRPDGVHHLRQSTLRTCGPASCAIAVAYFGFDVSERAAVLACRQQERGVRLLQLAGGVTRLAPTLAVTVATELPADDAVVLAAAPGGGHALCVALRGGIAWLHDPLLEGPTPLARERLPQRLRAPYVVVRGAFVSPARRGPCDPAAAHSPRR